MTDELLRLQRVHRIFRANKAFAKTLGLTEKQAIIAANRRTFEMTGFDALEAFQSVLTASEAKGKIPADERPLHIESVEQFINEWQAGLLPVAFGCCAASDFYDAFKAWMRAKGQRHTGNQTSFGRAIKGRWKRGVARLLDGRLAKVYAPNGAVDKTEIDNFRLNLIQWMQAPR